MLFTLRGHDDDVEFLAFSPDGKVLASASRDNSVRLWDVATGKTRRKFETTTRTLECVAFSPDGRILAFMDHATVKLWDLATGRALKTLVGHTDEVESVAFSPDGRHLVSCGADMTVRVWNVSVGEDE